MSNRFLKLLCSNCSNCDSPEFRDFTWDTEKNTLTCDTCGRKLLITKEHSDDGSYMSEWYKRNIKGKAEFRNNYILEVINEGST